MDRISDLARSNATAAVPTLDLNDLLLDHPAASFLFQCGDDIVIVDRAAQPDTSSLVLVESSDGFAVEPYSGQQAWGVVTCQIHKTA